MYRVMHSASIYDMYLAKLDRKINESLDGTEVLRAFRYVDDYLVVVKCFPQNVEALAGDVIALFSEHLTPLLITSELPHEAHIRFLDLDLRFNTNHMCWAYAPRVNKPLLSFRSAHSKLVKLAIDSLCVNNVLSKSCPHMVTASMVQQAERLSKSGYPTRLVVLVAEKVLKEAKLAERGRTSPAGRANLDPK